MMIYRRNMDIMIQCLQSLRLLLSSTPSDSLLCVNMGTYFQPQPNSSSLLLYVNTGTYLHPHLNSSTHCPSVPCQAADSLPHSLLPETENTMMGQDHHRYTPA